MPLRPALLLAALVTLVSTALPSAAVADPRHHDGGKGTHHQQDGTRHHHRRPIVPCSRGLVALTFDDGPSATVTPRMVEELKRLDVPATFFMVGSRVQATPGTALLVQQAGFAIGNHSWEHADMTRMTARQIRHTVGATARELDAAGVTPTAFVRPPYGAVDDRVRRVLAADGYTPVLWTIDPRDWADGTPRQIARRVVSAVRPHRTNIVLQHDGVTRSTYTLRALPREVATLQRRGYCFAGLDEHGEPTPPVPVATVSADRRQVAEGGSVRMTVRLDRPTSRPTTAVVATSGTATSGTDFLPARSRVSFGVGEQVAHFRLLVRQDDLDEPPEDITSTVSGGRGVQPTLLAQAPVRILDDDPPPTAELVGTTVRTSPLLDTTATIGLHLDRVSGWDVAAVVTTPVGRRRVVVPAGSRTATVSVTLPPSSPRRPVRRLPVELAQVQHAVAAAPATLVVRPPLRTRAEAVRAALEAIRWPHPSLGGLF
jgi:peptidoglycan/xylan/chitin deacetylase (PgdA/CDA1 family)